MVRFLCMHRGVVAMEKCINIHSSHSLCARIREFLYLKYGYRYNSLCVRIRESLYMK